MFFAWRTPLWILMTSWALVTPIIVHILIFIPIWVMGYPFTIMPAVYRPAIVPRFEQPISISVPIFLSHTGGDASMNNFYQIYIPYTCKTNRPAFFLPFRLCRYCSFCHWFEPHPSPDITIYLLHSWVWILFRTFWVSVSSTKQVWRGFPLAIILLIFLANKTARGPQSYPFRCCVQRHTT